MSKLIAALIASTFAAAAFAQTGATPPTQPAAGTTVEAKKDTAATPDTTTLSTDKKDAAKAKRAARKMKRAEKVGDKPVN